MTTLKHRTLTGFLWALFSAGAGKVLWLLAIAVIARYLGPESFGLIAIALTAMLYADSIGDLGAASALIYWKDQFEDVAEISFIINVLMGGFWLLVSWLVADSLADLFRMPELAAILPVLAISFLLKGLGNTHDAICQRRLDFRRRTLPEMALVTIKSLVAITLVIAGYGVWSLVYAQLAGLLAWLILLWLLIPWRPHFYYRRTLIGPLLHYGKGLVGVNLLSALTHHMDVLVVGRWLGANSLGLYQIATKLPETSITTATWVVSKVLFPAFSDHHRQGARLEQPFLLTLKYVGLFAIPASVMLALLAESLLTLVFGVGWDTASHAMQWLAAYTCMRALGTPAGDMLKATGRTQLLARLAIIKAIPLLPLLLFGVKFGINGVAAAMLVSAIINLTLNYLVISRVENIVLTTMFRCMIPGLVVGLIIICTSMLFQSAACCTDLLIASSIHIVLLLIAYLASSFLLAPDLFHLLRKTLEHRS